MAKICNDPGHSGYPDPGATNPITGLREADVTLPIGKSVAHYLDAVGHLARMTRTEWEQPETDDLGYRVDISNDWGADAFVSIHCNSAENPAAHGFEVWTSPGQTEGDRLATCIFNQIAGEFPDMTGRTDYSDGDPDKESKFYVLTQTEAPACLVEMAFISNPLECQWLADPAWQDRMARAISRGITDFFIGRGV